MKMATGLTKKELVERFAESGHPDRLGRAAQTVLEGRVKRHTFVPSGRVLYTVVGRSGDEFVDPAAPFCSCEYFFFSVLGGKSDTCYHLLAYRMASETGGFSEARLHDEEFRYFLRLLSSDLLDRSGDKEDKQSQDPSEIVPR
jgi:predicted nucleic acid-binding Zn finger protein